MIYTTIDNFYVTDEQLENSPSRADGISREVENQLRIYGCEILQEGGILLDLPQAVMATGQALLQRFYCKESLLKYNIKRVAWACCWLATKLEEAPRRLRDVLSVFVRIDRRREGKGDLAPLDIYGQEYSMRRQEMVKVERHLLRTFGFILHVDHPHKAMLNYLNLLETSSAMKQEAWALANDSLRTTLCVRFRSEVLACGLILLASRRCQEKMPDNPSWLDIFDVDLQGVYTVAREVQALYSMPKVHYISVYRENRTTANPQAEPAKQQVGSLNATPQPSNSDTDSEKRKESEIMDVSGTTGDNPLSTDAEERVERDEDQRSGQKRSEREEEEERSSRRYRRRTVSHSTSEDDRSERRRSSSPRIMSRSHSRDYDYDRSRERRRSREGRDRSGRPYYRDRRERIDRDYRYRDRDRDYRRR